MQEQTGLCPTDIEAILAAAGSSSDNSASATVVMAGEDDFAGMYDEWLEWFPKDPPACQGAQVPARIPGPQVSTAVIAEAR